MLNKYQSPQIKNYSDSFPAFSLYGQIINYYTILGYSENVFTILQLHIFVCRGIRDVFGWKEMDGKEGELEIGKRDLEGGRIPYLNSKIGKKGFGGEGIGSDKAAAEV